MGVFNYEYDVATQVTPDRLFKALVLDRNTVFPKVYPQAFKKLENISGNGGPGTIFKAYLAGQGQQVNNVEVLDTEKLEFGYTIVEGDELGDSIEKIYYHYKIVEGPNGGSVVKATAKFFTKGGFELSKNYAAESKLKYAGLYKAVEDYLLQDNLGN